MTPELDSDALARLTPGVRRRYAATWAWIQAHYRGPWDRTEPIQAFVDRTLLAGPAPPAIRARVLRSLVNNYVRPAPRGPPVALRAAAAAAAARRHPKKPVRGAAAAAAAAAVWWNYVPEYLRPRLRRDAAWADRIAQYVRALGANPLRRNLVRAYVVHVLHVLADRAACAAADDFLRLDPRTLAAHVADATGHRLGQRRLCRIAINRFIAEVVFRGHPALAARLHLRVRDLPPPTTAASGGSGGGGGEPHPSELAVARGVHGAGGAARDHFTPAEVAALLALPDLAPRDRCMLRIMAETGLRRRAVAWLETAAVYDAATGAALPVGAATEKGLVLRRFVLSPAARDLLAAYVADAHPCPTRTRWLFPCPTDPRRPVTPQTVNEVLVRACRRAGISGRHCHAHGLRKHVICSLMACGNRIEDVAKWIGHRSVNTTFGTYWDATPEELIETMVIPWLPRRPEGDKGNRDHDDVVVGGGRA